MITITKKLLWCWILVSVLLTLAVILQALLLIQADQGDLNHDGRVNVKDLSIMAHHYGKKDEY